MLFTESSLNIVVPSKFQLVFILRFADRACQYNQQLTNLMRKILFYNKSVIRLYMFRAHSARNM